MSRLQRHHRPSFCPQLVKILLQNQQHMHQVEVWKLEELRKISRALERANQRRPDTPGTAEESYDAGGIFR